MLIQADPEYHGRLTSLTFVPFGVQSMAGLAFGNLADGIGERSMLIIMGIATMAISAVSGLPSTSASALPPAPLWRSLLTSRRSPRRRPPRAD